MKYFGVFLMLVIIASILVLPWIMLESSLELPSLIQQGVSLLFPVLDSSGLKSLPAALDQLQDVSQLEPLDILQLEFVSWRLKLVMLIPVVAALIGLLATALSFIRQDELARLAYWVTAAVAVLAVLLMVVGMPLLLRIGVSGDLAVRLALAVLDVRLALGFWITWVAVLGLAVVSILLAITEKPKTRSTYGYYSPQRRY